MEAFLIKYYEQLDADIAATTNLICNSAFTDMAQFERMRGRLNGIKLAKLWAAELYNEMTTPITEEKKDEPTGTKY